MVFLENKAGIDYPFSLENPNEYLTERAIQRREKQNISLDSTDLPVNPAYVAGLKNLGVDVYFSSRWLNAVLIQTNPDKISAIQSLIFVDSIALIAENEKLSFAHDPFLPPTEFEEPTSVVSSTDLQNSMLQVDRMHQDGIRGENMLIAVLDNGFRGVDTYTPFEHLWTENKIVGHRDFVNNSDDVFNEGSHGTAVFSTIAAKYADDFVGTAYEANFILCVTEENGSEDRIEEYNWILGAEYADSLGVDIINTSLGYRTFDISSHDYQYEDLDGETPVISKGAKMASDKGIIVVASAGNEGDNPPTEWRYITPPADATNVLTVGSVNPDFEWSDFSSIGPAGNGLIKPDVAAMGLGTAIISGSGSIKRGDGTSYASPQIAGLAAGIWQDNPSWTNLEVIDAIKLAGHNADNPNTLIGYGVPFYSYLEEGKVLSVSDILKDKINVYPNPFTDEKLFLKIEEQIDAPILIEVIDNKGKLIYKNMFDTSEQNDIIEFSLKDIQEGLYFLSLQYADERKVVKLINFK
jgi:hypothetical protein